MQPCLGRLGAGLRGPYVMLLLLLLTFLLRIYRLPQLSFRGDEVITVVETGVPSNLLLESLRRPGRYPPLHSPALHGWMALVGTNELSARYLSVMNGVLLVSLLYVLANRLSQSGATRLGLWAAGLAAINPLLIWDAQDNRMYPLLAVFSLVSFISCLSILQGQGGWRAWLSFVASATLALYTHYLAVFVLLTENLVCAVLIWRMPERRRRAGLWLGAQAAVAVLFAPWLLKALGEIAAFTTDFLPSVSGLEFARRTVVGLSLGYSVDSQASAVLGLGFLAVALLGLLPAAHHPPQSRRASVAGFSETQGLLALLLYLVTPLACIAVFSTLRFSIFDERYLMSSLPAYLVLLARGA